MIVNFLASGEKKKNNEKTIKIIYTCCEKFATSFTTAYNKIKYYILSKNNDRSLYETKFCKMVTKKKK